MRKCTYQIITVYCFFGFFLAPCSKCNLITGILEKLPSPIGFLTTVLNVTNAKEATSMADSFAFSLKSEYIRNISILYYREDGFFTVHPVHSQNVPVILQEEIKIIIHGFQSYGTTDWTREMVEAYQRFAYKNIYVIDWRGIAGLGYFEAACSTKHLGMHVGNWLFYNLLDGRPERLFNVHCIGHSLGAHICGFIGKTIAGITGKRYRIGKISALDAAAPLFEFPIKAGPSRRLHKNDAYHVAAYHTNIGFFGFHDELGNHDIYIANGGPVQPGCNKGFNILDTLICSHGKAHEVFTKAITSQNYVAKKCSNRVYKFLNFCENNKRVILGETGNLTQLRGTFFINIDKYDNPVRI